MIFNFLILLTKCSLNGNIIMKKLYERWLEIRVIGGIK